MQKTVLITGCSSGIGRAAAHRFAADGWNVIAGMRRTQAAAELESLPALFPVTLDVTDISTINSAVAEGVRRFGGIDLLINNAGYGQYGILEATPAETIRHQFDVNVFGVMEVTRAVLPHFRKAKRGMIINISSGAGIFTLPMAAFYCASKYALEGFSEALAYELAPLNISIKVIQPHGGVTETAFTQNAAGMQTGTGELEDYQEFMKQTQEAFGRMGAASSQTASDVAEIIYTAATDGTDQFRYLAGDDKRGFVRARHELPDQEYIRFMRSFFTPADNS